MEILDIKNALKSKKEQFDQRNIIVTESDLLLFLEKVYFKFNEGTLEALNAFINDNNVDDIVNFLMAEAIVNPKF